MTEERYIEEKVGRRNPFLVPEGYFEGLTSQVMQLLPEREHQPRAKSIWLRPWFYAAASICVLLVSATIFWFSFGAGGHATSQKEVAEAVQESTDTYFDEAVDYVMLDNQDIYAYLSE